MRQDTQASRTATNKQTVQQEMRIHQEKRKMSPLPSSMSKKFCNNRENSPETEKKTELVLGKSFGQGKVFSTSELAASDMIQHKQLKIKTPEFSHCKKEAADLEDLPGQSSELIAKRAILFKERGRSYLAHKKNKTNQYSKNLYLKQEVIATSSQVEPSDKTADKDKHFTTSEVAAGCNKMKIQSQHLSTSEVASGRTVQPSSHLSTSEVAAKNRGAKKRLKLLSKDGTLVQKNGESVKVCNLSTSEVAVNHKSTSAGSTSGRSLYDKEVVRQRIKSRKAENRNKQLEEQRIERGIGHGAKSEEELKHIEEERRREEEMVRERRRTERRAEEMRREEERLEERLRVKKREERMIEERIRDKKRAEEKRIEEEIIAQRISEKKREEKMIEERIREKRREERKAAARLAEPRSTSEVAAKVALSRTVVDMVSEEEEDVVIEKVGQVAPSQMFPVSEAHHKKHQSDTQREISPPRFYNKLDNDSESMSEDEDEDEDEDEVIAIQENLQNPKRSTSEMFVENLQKLKNSQKQWFEAPHKKTSDNLFEQLLGGNKKVEKTKDGDGSKKVKDRVDQFLESCQRILPDADFPPVFKKISKYMSSISKVGTSQ